MMSHDWVPTIYLSPDNGTVLASFSPWDQKASFTKACLVEVGQSTCQGVFVLSREQTDVRFADVPCNKTFILKLRSYDANMVPRQKIYWDSPSNVRLPCAVDATEPTVPQDPSTELVAVGVVSVIALVLFITGIIVFRLKKPELDKYLAAFCPPTCKNSTLINNQHILPVYMEENQAYGRAVRAHIQLLNRTCGLNIRTYDEQRRDIQEGKDIWAEKNLNKSTAVLVYHCKTVDDLIKGNDLPDDCSFIYADVCRNILRQLEKIDYEDKNVVHVKINVGKDTRSIKNVIKLVKIKKGKLSVINTATVVERLTKVKRQNDPIEEETRVLCQCVSELYSMTFTHSEESDTDAFIENDPMLGDGILDMEAQEYPYRFV